ncbi:HXXEE domain-containing protein [Vibrio salinus]|uniref:HXXEE domain-containing protein n=1 Tax=Vibrio salinus TaxID=2899784 RepID=UPI001E4C3BD1|nr:HXXEE domain-containing protein [Vibrio salinus]MCE0494328.1 HXXEE domain-containing protein [Vibrio salinus]
MLDVHGLSILLAIAAMLHVTEEFIWPGGFIAWYRELCPPQEKGRGPEYLIWINTLMMWFIILAMYFGNTQTGASIWLGVATMLVINAGFHILGVIRLRKYSPGIVTAVCLYIPLFIIGISQYLTTHLISTERIAIYLVIAIAYHMLSAKKQAQ